MLRAMVDVSAELGAGNVAVAQVVARSSVSRRTFYEIFEDREDCFLAAFDDGIARLAGEVVPVYTNAVGWRRRIRMGLIAALSFFDREPRLARLLVVESLGAGPRALARRARVLDVLIGVVDDGRCGARRGEPPQLAAEAMVGAVLAVVHGRLVEAHPGPLVELVNPLMSMIVLPYLGPAAARKERGLALPSLPAASREGEADPLRSLGMRLTYRTVRVLAAVAASPSASNRVVGNRAGITDQGQISKLLTRLQGLGLVENRPEEPARRGPNAWTLTSKGLEVHGAIADRTVGA